MPELLLRQAPVPFDVFGRPDSRLAWKQRRPRRIAMRTLLSFEGLGAALLFRKHVDLENSIATSIFRMFFRSREQGHTVDALALRADEGRGRLR